MKTKNIKKITFAILFVVLIVSAFVFGLPFIKLKIFEHKIKKDLLEAYPGAIIRSIHATKEPVTMEEFSELYSYNWSDGFVWDEDLYVFEVDIGLEKNNVFKPVLGLATADGNVVFDEYAFVYYQNDLQSYVMDIINPEENFPGIEFEYFDYRTGNESRLVETDRCSTFKGFLDTEHVGYSKDSWFSREYAGCWIKVNIDYYDEDINLETCEKLAKVLTEADCQVYIHFLESYTGHGFELGKYYPDNDIYGYGNFNPSYIGTQYNWKRPDE